MIRNVSTNYKIVKNILNKGFYFETSFFAKPKATLKNVNSKLDICLK